MSKFFTACLSISLLALGSIAITTKAEDTVPTNQYPASFIAGYNEECIQTSIEEGLGEKEAKKLCDCTIDEFAQRYNLEKFQQLTNASATDKSAEAALIEVGQFCFEELLYEE